jgi:hypothetical protein
MELFVMVLVVSMVALGLTVVAFAMSMGVDDAGDSGGAQDGVTSAVTAVHTVPSAAPRFFADDSLVATAVGRRLAVVPPEALLLHIERHIRLEQAAAENFLASPTLQSLHSPTMSPLLN